MPNCPKCGIPMRMSKKGTWWYCPTNLKDEFHKGLLEVGKEPKESQAKGFTRVGDIKKELPKEEIEQVVRNDKLDFEILLMEEIGVMQDSLEKIYKALEIKTKQ